MVPVKYNDEVRKDKQSLVLVVLGQKACLSAAATRNSHLLGDVRSMDENSVLTATLSQRWDKLEYRTSQRRPTKALRFGPHSLSGGYAQEARWQNSERCAVAHRFQRDSLHSEILLGFNNGSTVTGSNA